MKHIKKIYWGSTVLFSLYMLMGAGQYFFNTAEVQPMFIALDYPDYLLYILGALKVAGVVAILTNKNIILKEWAYAGFFFTLMLAIIGHAVSGIPSPLGAAVGLIILATSYVSDKKYFGMVDRTPKNRVNLEN